MQTSPPAEPAGLKGNGSMAGARASFPAPMTEPIPLEEMAKGPLKSLNGTRDKFLANFDGANLTED